MRVALLATGVVILGLAFYAQHRSERRATERAARAGDVARALPEVSAPPRAAAGSAGTERAAEGPAAVYEIAASAGDASAHRHVVRSGESLASIALRYYGDAARTQAIYQANRDRIRDPEHLHPGQTLVIP